MPLHAGSAASGRHDVMSWWTEFAAVVTRPRRPGGVHAVGQLHHLVSGGGYGRFGLQEVAHGFEAEQSGGKLHHGPRGPIDLRGLADPDLGCSAAGALLVSLVQVEAAAARRCTGLDRPVRQRGVEEASGDVGNVEGEAGLVDDEVHILGGVDRAHHEIGVAGGLDDALGVADPVVQRHHVRLRGVGLRPVACRVDLLATKRGRAVEELAGQIADFDDVDIDQRHPSDAQPEQ